MHFYTAATIAAGKWACEHLRDTMKTTELAQLAESLPLSKTSSNPGEENTEKTRCGHDRGIVVANCMVAVVVCADARVRADRQRPHVLPRSPVRDAINGDGVQFGPVGVLVVSIP